MPTVTLLLDQELALRHPVRLPGTDVRYRPSRSSGYGLRNIRRSVLEQPLQSGRFEARRTVYSVALLVFLRVHGEVRRPETIATDRERNESGSAGPLRRLRAGLEADLVCYIAVPLAASWQPALCTCGFWPSLRAVAAP